MRFMLAAGLLCLVGVVSGSDIYYLHGCSSHCSLNDEDLTCWNKTNAFFERATLSLMRQYIKVQVHRAQFMENKGIKPDYKAMGDETVRHWSHANPANIEDEDGMTDMRMYKAVAHGLMDDVASLVDELKGTPPNSTLLCPHGCEKNSKHWMWMFIGSAIVTGILSALLVTVVCLLDMRDRRQSMLEDTKELLNK